MTRRSLVIGLLLLASVTTHYVEAADDSPEAKLREQLRTTMLQLRTAQNERAALQASQAESDQKVKALTAQVDTLTKQSSAAEKTAADQAGQVATLREAVGKWEAAYQQATQVLTAKEGERAKASAQVIELKRVVADREAKNRALFNTANEILTRYERFSLGDALAAKEPFTGLTRVKLENLVQGYEDKLAEQRVRPAAR